MRRRSASATSVRVRRRRFRFGDFFVRMWLLKARWRLTLAFPVNLKRFIARSRFEYPVLRSELFSQISFNGIADLWVIVNRKYYRDCHCSTTAGS